MGVEGSDGRLGTVAADFLMGVLEGGVAVGLEGEPQGLLSVSPAVWPRLLEGACSPRSPPCPRSG